jgi:hypothetical protein
MDELLENIDELVIDELKRANAVFPQFHGNHEAWAVLKEEVEEADIENTKVNKILDMLWNSVRFNHKKEQIIPLCNSLKKHALYNSAESIQIAAMCQKYIDYLEVK